MTDQYGERGHWHSGDEKPEIDGVYQVQEEEGDEFEYFSFFDGQKWRGHWVDIESAYENRGFDGIDSKTTEWRGLAKKPKENNHA